MTDDRQRIDDAVRVLRSGGVVAYPTDTLYGLAVDPLSEGAVSRLFAVKARDAGRAIPLIAADEEQARRVAQFTPAALRVVGRLWPGPLSIVVAALPHLAPGVAADDGSVAVRVPASSYAVQLARTFGGCITATSANLSGDTPTNDPAVVTRTLGHRIDYLLDGGLSPGGPPSTIVDLRNAPRLVRAGAVPWERVLESLE